MEPHYPPQHIRRRAARRRKQRRVLVFLLFASILTGGWLLGRCADFIRAAAHPGVYAVAVDAGHGGSDTGAEGVIQESDMTAATAAALCALLEQDPHFIVVNTRADYNTGAKPDERAKAANAKHADLLLSIHGNADASPNSTAHCSTGLLQWISYLVFWHPSRLARRRKPRTKRLVIWRLSRMPQRDE